MRERKSSLTFRDLRNCIAVVIETSGLYILRRMYFSRLPGNNKDIPKLSQNNPFLSKAVVNYTNISSITPIQNLFLVLASPLHLNKRGVIRVTISISLG